MPQLFSEDEQLPVSNFQVLSCPAGLERNLRATLPVTEPNLTIASVGAAPYQVNLNRDAVLLLDLPNGHCAIGTIQHSLDQSPLGVSGFVGKLWHRFEGSSEFLNSSSKDGRAGFVIHHRLASSG
jgi:hypothetical protein